MLATIPRSPLETESRAAAQDRELELLNRQLDYLWDRSPFYQGKLAEAGVPLTLRIRRHEDLAKLPFTAKAELRHSLELSPPLGAHAAAPRNALIQIQSTSGTTGSPSYFGLTKSDRDMWSELGARCLTAGGFHPGDLALNAWSMSKGFAGGVPVVQMLQYMGICVLPVGAESGAHRLLSVLRDLSPRVVVGTPSFLRHVAEQAPELIGLAARDLGVERLVVGAEPGGGIPMIRARLQELWGASCCEVLGNSDIAPLIWGECLERSGMHFAGQGHVLVELIDPDTGAQLESARGVTGELVYTALTREASPLLRFRSGDIAEVLDTACACGRTSCKVRCIGRVDDMLIVRGVNVWPTAVQSVIADHHPATTGRMRILVDFDGHSTDGHLRVQVERAERIGPDEVPALTQRVTAAIRSQLAFNPDVEIVAPGTIETPGNSKVRLVERVGHA